MKEAFKIIVQVVRILSFGGVIFTGVLGVLYEILGHAKFEQILSTIGISNGFERTWIVSAIMLIVLVVTCFIKVN